MKVKLLFIPLSIIISIVVSIWMTKPTYDSLKTNKEELASQTEKLSKVTSQKKSMESVKTAYENLGIDKELIDNALPSKKDLDNLYAELVGKLSESNIFTNKISFSAPREIKNSKSDTTDSADTILDSSSKSKGGENGVVVDQKRLNEVETTIEGIGGYPELKNLLAAVYSMNRYLNVSSLEISKARQEGQEIAQQASNGLLQLRVGLSAYFEELESAEQVVQLASSNGAVMSNLLKGGLSNDVIEEYKERRTKTPFNFPFSIEGAGKENIFTR